MRCHPAFRRASKKSLHLPPPHSGPGEMHEGDIGRQESAASGQTLPITETPGFACDAPVCTVGAGIRSSHSVRSGGRSGVGPSSPRQRRHHFGPGVKQALPGVASCPCQSQHDQIGPAPRFQDADLGPFSEERLRRLSRDHCQKFGGIDFRMPGRKEFGLRKQVQIGVRRPAVGSQDDPPPVLLKRSPGMGRACPKYACVLGQ